MIFCSDALDVTLPARACCVETCTAFYDSFRRRAAPGQTVVNGRVLIYPFGHFGTGVPPMLLGRVRQEILQDVLDAAGFDVPMVRGLACLAPYCFRSGDTTALYLDQRQHRPGGGRDPLPPAGRDASASIGSEDAREHPARAPAAPRAARRWALAWAAWKRP